MKISIVAFDEFTDIDVWLMWDLFKRVVLFTSGPGTRKKIHDQAFLSSFHLNPEKQLDTLYSTGVP